jgi:hypothetical protein
MTEEFSIGKLEISVVPPLAFYLQYSAVPEPSTYIMVTGLLMVPGMSYVRRFRKKKAGVVMKDTPNSV